MNLVFVPNRNHWCVVKDNVWYRLTSYTDIAELLIIVRAQIIDTKTLQDFPAILCHASVEQTSARESMISLYDESENLVAQHVVQIDSGALIDVNWRSGAHVDGWIELDAELEIEANGVLLFEIFLPESDLFGEKQLVATIDDKAVFQCGIPRGTRFKTPPVTLDKVDSATIVRLAASYAEQVPGDQRDLGVLVLGILVNNTPVTLTNSNYGI